MKRRPGVGGLQNAAAARDQYRLLGENVAKLRIDIMNEQLSTFRSQLEDFARKHKTGVQIVDICLSTRAHNGDLISLEELLKLLKQRHKGARETVSDDDCLRAISKLKVLHFVTIDEVQRRLSWPLGRATDALETLLDEGLAMIDDGDKDGRRQYWFPCISSISSHVTLSSFFFFML